MKKMVFSRRIVFVYTLIVIIPLLIFVIGVTYSLMSRQDNQIRDEEISFLHEKCKTIEEAKNTFDLVESIISGDSELSLFLARPESCTENELINTILSKADYLEQVYEITPDIYSIRIFSTNKKIPERWPVFLNTSRIENEEKKRWQLDYQAKYLGNQYNLQLPSFCTTRKLSKGPKIIGYIQISYKMDTVFPFLYDDDSKNDSYLILKKNQNFSTLEIIKESTTYNKNKLTEKEFYKLFKAISKKDSGNISFGKFNKLVCWEYVSDLDFYIVRNISYKPVRNKFLFIFILVLLAFCFISVGLYFVIKYATRRLMSGIYSVMDGMKKVKSGNYSVKIPISGEDEVSETQETFNAMTAQISSQIEQIKIEQELIADTEMKAMQNQINAHFLYNVLETIRMQAVLADQDDISESLQILGKMMRYCLRWRIHRVSLLQEIEYIRSYIYILNIRNDYTITLNIDIDDSLLNIEIPKMTLQPLIENAFVHAIEKEEKDATLKVYSTLSEDKTKVFLTVQDFGCGMSEEQITLLQEYLADESFERNSTGSIGLKNIQQRLTVFFGNDYKIIIKSKLGEGTSISVPIPNKQIEQLENKTNIYS